MTGYPKQIYIGSGCPRKSHSEGRVRLIVECFNVLRLACGSFREIMIILNVLRFFNFDLRYSLWHSVRM